MAAQDHVVTRAQVLAAGLTPGWLEAALRAGRWQVLRPGCYVSHTGPVTARQRHWAAVLSAGLGAVLSDGSAAWLDGLRDSPPARMHVTIPAGRKIQAAAGIVVHRSRNVDTRAHPTRLPPRTRIEETILDLVDVAVDAGEVVEVVTRACQRRLTQGARLVAAADARQRLRHRGLLLDLLAEVIDGVLSPLELHYRRDVEKPHGLPRTLMNAADGQPGRRRYRDARNDEHRLLIELDGRAAHPGEARHRDRARDNAAAAQGWVTLRFGWHEVVGDPCGCAAQIAFVLAARGWRGVLEACSTACTARLGA